MFKNFFLSESKQVIHSRKQDHPHPRIKKEGRAFFQKQTWNIALKSRFFYKKKSHGHALRVL